MTSIGWATLDVIPSVRGLRGELDRQTGPGMAAAGLTGGRRFGDAAGKEASARFGTAMRRAAKVTAVGLLAGTAAAIKFGGDSLAEAREAQKVGAQTDAVIKSTGRAAKVTARDVGKLSGRLSKMAGIDDELIQSGANVLLTFKNIRNESGKGNKVFDEAAESALNMSVAMGTGLKGASLQVGRALNDPVKGVTALGRAGVQFSEDQKAAIKTMVESGDTLGAQKIILKELDDQFKGSAKAQATEADKLGVAFGNLKEDVGTALIPVMDDLAVFLRKKGIPAARDFAGWVRDDLAPAVKDAADDVKPLIKNAKDLAKFLNDLPSAAKIAGITALIGGGAAIKLRGGSSGALGTAGKVLGVVKPIRVFETNPAALGGGLGGGLTGSGAGKGALLRGAAKATIVGAGAVYLGNAYVNYVTNDPNKGYTLSKSKDATDPNSVFADPRRRMDSDKLAIYLDAMEKKAQGLGRELDLVGSKKVEPKFAVPGLAEGRAGLREFLRLQINAGKPITPYINTTSIERAIEVARTLNAALANQTLVERGSDGGVNFQHGGTGGTNQRATFDNVTIVAHDYNDFVQQAQRRAQSAGIGGFR